MARQVTIAAAQMGPNNEGARREEIVGRLLVLMEQAIDARVEILVYPELALTTYFPKKVRNDAISTPPSTWTRTAPSFHIPVTSGRARGP